MSESFTIMSGVPQGSILGPLLFLLIFNDLTDVVKNSQIAKYADDTVLYVHGKTGKGTAKLLTEDLSLIADWFKDKKLITNLKKGKTEALLFGIAKKVTNHLEDFEVFVNDTKITVTDQYIYLGVAVDSTLNLNSFFDTCYKKASSRLNLLAKLRYMLNTDASKSIYNSMILPTFTYCGLHLLQLTNSQEYKLLSIKEQSIS